MRKKNISITIDMELYLTLMNSDINVSGECNEFLKARLDVINQKTPLDELFTKLKENEKSMQELKIKKASLQNEIKQQEKNIDEENKEKAFQELDIMKQVIEGSE